MDQRRPGEPGHSQRVSTAPGRLVHRLRNLSACLGDGSHFRPLTSAAVAVKSAEEHCALAREVEQDAARYPDERGEALLDAAGYWERAGEVDKATALLEEVLTLSGEDADYARHALADICFKQGADSDAWAHLQVLEETEQASTGSAELVAELLEERGDYEAALRWFDRAINAVDADELAKIRQRGAMPSLTAIRLFGRQRCRAELGLPVDDLDRVADVAEDNRREFAAKLDRATARTSAVSRPEAIEMLVWRRDEHQRAAQRWPEVFTAEVGARYADIEQRLREESRKLQAAKVMLIPGAADGFGDYLERTGDDPAEEQARLAYAGQVRDSGRTMSWPPGRNQPCWCGSARKYKKCCGLPATTR